ncbi:MAG: 1-acyl-sn-glycerol-3-phosphate acyltransferase [Lentisphaerae bacterium]|nr:1-acyl-sn-glycerol-3-phosphate acyltransferase [Lentisphaerota bacterium]
MSILRKIWRLTLFLIWMWPFAIFSIFRGIGGRAGIKRVAYCTRAWGKFLVWNFGVKVKFTTSHPIEEGMLIVSNHQSYLDVLLHASLFPIRFTPKAEIRRWPVLGFYLGISRPVWIDRKNRQKSGELLNEFHRTLADGVSLLVYPEGTTTDGEHGMLPFKPTSFATVIGTDFKIQPVITHYFRDQDNWNPAWYGDQTLLPHVWKFLGRKATRVEVIALEPVTPLPGEDRKQLAARVEALMLEAMQKYNAQ